MINNEKETAFKFPNPELGISKKDIEGDEKDNKALMEEMENYFQKNHYDVFYCGTENSARRLAEIFSQGAFEHIELSAKPIIENEFDFMFTAFSHDDLELRHKKVVMQRYCENILKEYDDLQSKFTGIDACLPSVEIEEFNRKAFKCNGILYDRVDKINKILRVNLKNNFFNLIDLNSLMVYDVFGAFYAKVDKITTETFNTCMEELPGFKELNEKYEEEIKIKETSLNSIISKDEIFHFDELK